MMSPVPDRLLAKAWDGEGAIPPEITLPGHTAAVRQAAEVLLKQRGAASLAAVGLPEAALERLRRLVLLSAVLHDLGKANEHFQRMIRRQQQGQLVRHEAVGAWLAWQPCLRPWLESAAGSRADLALVLAAVAGHHRKFRAQAIDAHGGLGTRVRVFAAHPDVIATLRLISTPPADMTDVDLQLHAGVPGMQARLLFADLERTIADVLGADSTARPMLALLKVLLINADVAGSAQQQGAVDGAWIDRLLTQRADRAALEALVARRLAGHPLRPFQRAVACSSAPITLVEAGCGSGKTLAAYVWFACQHAGRQLWITYPTTGTALEGYRGYLHGIDGLATDLESGRRDIDLTLCGLNDGAGTDEAQRDADRLAALRAWGRDAIACTVDTVLGLVQNQRKGLYAWAGLCHAAVVFDEIHAYDDRLFGCLLRFLGDLPGIPALLMTASLPAARRAALERLCRERHGCELRIISGPAELEALPRYRLALAEASDAWQTVGAALAEGAKVLWVANTVDRCIATAQAAVARAWRPLIYHSRFRYLDRVARHRDIIAAFAGPGPCLAVCTQVAEMSLDLSTDLLVSDLAPIPALIQRFGRLNRRSTPQSPAPPRPALVLPVENPLPYTAEALDEARSWLHALQGGDRSQRDLVAAWRSDAAASVAEVPSAWFDGGLDTEPREVREASPGITVLLEDDAAEVRADPQRAIAYALPMPPPPRSLEWQRWPRLAYLPLAPRDAIDYDPCRGALWR